MQENKTHCKKCNSANTFVIYQHDYNSLRGYCRDCGSNWPES